MNNVKKTHSWDAAFLAARPSIDMGILKWSQEIRQSAKVYPEF